MDVTELSSKMEVIAKMELNTNGDENNTNDSATIIVKKTKRYAQKYKVSWEQDDDFRGWLKRSQRGEHFAYCMACEIHLAITAGTQDIRKHSKGKKHIKNLSSLQTRQAVIDEQSVMVGNRDTLDDTIKECELKLASFINEHDLPERVVYQIPKLIQSLCPDSEVARQIRCRDTKLPDMQEGWIECAGLDASSLPVQPPFALQRPLDVPGGSEGRLLLGAGPSNLSPKVKEALKMPLLGHLHPEFLKIMDDVRAGLAYLFQTQSQMLCCFSGTGHCGMEGMIANLLEEGDSLLVVESGIWGQRAADIASRMGVNVRVLRTAIGAAITPSQLEASMVEHWPAVVLVVHVESSTGMMQPLQGLGDVCRNHGALLVVDAVASAGGLPFLMDQWLVDAVYTGTHQVLSSLPGLAPCALNNRAKEKLLSRKTPVRSFDMDLKELANYWGCDDQPRRYHHTGPISSVYALRAALAELSSEGIIDCWGRHEQCAGVLHKGLQERLGLELLVNTEELRAPTVTTVKVPIGVDWKNVCNQIIAKHQIEISGGLGPTAGMVWRIGLMGTNCSLSNVELVLCALEEAIKIEASKFKL